MKIHIFLGILFFAGSFPFQLRADETAIYRERLNQLYIGMTKQQLIQSVGPPNSKSIINTKKFGQAEVYFYQTRETPTKNKPVTVSTPVIITKGKVSGWGWHYYHMIDAAKD